MNDDALQRCDFYTRDLKVMYVEDDQMLLSVGESLFSRFFDAIHTFSNGADAIEYYKNNHQDVDLIISDVLMPGMNGIEFVSNIKEIDPLQKIVLYSACTDTETINEITQLNVDAFIPKPPRKDEMEICFNKIGKELHDAAHGDTK